MRLTRRQLLQSSLVLSGIGACEATRTCAMDLVSEVRPGEQNLLSVPVVVPSDFVGIHAHRWPVGSPQSCAPTYAFGAARSHDFDGAAWYRIHTAPDSYNWSKLDAWVSVHSAAKRTLIYTVYGTPSWLASDTTRRDPYGEPGGAASPKDLQPFAQFVQTLMLRYNGDGERRISFIETWNEPNFAGRTDDFWWGSAAQLAALGRVLYDTAKGVDPRVRILSPGFAGNLAGSLSLAAPRLTDVQSSSLYRYLTAADGRGALGAQCCDGIAFHCYDAPLRGSNAGFLPGDSTCAADAEPYGSESTAL